MLGKEQRYRARLAEATIGLLGQKRDAWTLVTCAKRQSKRSWLVAWLVSVSALSRLVRNNVRYLNLQLIPDRRAQRVHATLVPNFSAVGVYIYKKLVCYLLAVGIAVSICRTSK